VTPRAVPITLDGRAMEAAFWGPPPADAPTLVLLHEGLGCVALWRDFPARLAQQLGCGVFAYSRFGYGQSAGEPLPWPPCYLHDHARGVLPRVLAAAGIFRHVLLGHSDGGTIAAIAAAEGTAPGCAGLIMLAAHFFVEDICITAIEAAREAFLAGSLRPRLARYHRDVDNAFLGWNGAWLDPRFRALDLSPQLAALRVPVLATQGAGDEYGTPAQLEWVDRLVTAPRSTRLIEGARHAAHEQAPAAVLEAVARFMQDNAATFR
jgi:pimeloyl-ACP methyl ester carboxylesterase